jgi:hypothetical protein
MLCALMQILDLAARLVAVGKGDQLLTAVYVGQELRGVQSDARFLRVFEHGTLSGSDVIAELIYLTSRKEKGVVCTPIGHVTLERRLLAILPPEADKVNLAEGFWLAVFFLLIGAWVLNTSPTGSTTQRFLAESWHGTVARAEQLGTATIEQNGMAWASANPCDADCSAFMRRALTMTRRLLLAGLWVDESGTTIQPQIPASGSRSADYSWLQCFNALLGRNATKKARYAVWAMACSNPDCRDRFKSPLCVHGLYAIHRHFELGREPCVRCFDQEMYFVPPATSAAGLMLSSSPAAASTNCGSSMIPAATSANGAALVSDADRLLQVAASVSSLALVLPSFDVGASAGAASSSWLSPQDRSSLDAVGKTLHRFLMRHEYSLRNSGSATGFSGARTSTRRLQTKDEVGHSHVSARGVEAGDPGPVALLRRQVARQPGQRLTDSDDSTFVARAAAEAGKSLSTFIAELASAVAVRTTASATASLADAAAGLEGAGVARSGAVYAMQDDAESPAVAQSVAEQLSVSQAGMRRRRSSSEAQAGTSCVSDTGVVAATLCDSTSPNDTSVLAGNSKKLRTRSAPGLPSVAEQAQATSSAPRVKVCSQAASALQALQHEPVTLAAAVATDDSVADRAHSGAQLAALSPTAADGARGAPTDPDTYRAASRPEELHRDACCIS